MSPFSIYLVYKQAVDISAAAKWKSINAIRKKCTHFGQLILGKIGKVDATTRCQILKAKLHQISLTLGLSPRPRWVEPMELPGRLAVLRGLLLRGGREGEG